MDATTATPDFRTAQPSEASDTAPPNGYLLLFRDTNWDQGKVPREEFQQIIDRVTAWVEGLVQQGKVAAGLPLLEGGKIVSGPGGRTVTDGPFPESKEAIGGFLQVKVKTMEEAVEIARTNPLLEYGLIIEVRTTATNCPASERVKKLLAPAGS
jgi:hypothetical protein